MKNFLLTLALAVAALCFTACPPAGDNTNAGSNAENADANAAAKPEKDLASMISEAGKGANEAWMAKNGAFFEGFLADGFVGVGRYGRATKAQVPKMISDNPCEIKSSTSSDQEAFELDEGVALNTSKVTQEVVCDGKTQPSPLWAAMVYVKDGDTWKAAYRQTLPTADAKGEYGPAPEGAKDNPPAEGDKEITAALSEMLKAGWEAWSKSDVKWFEANASDKYVAITATEGRSDRAARMKYQAEHKCEIKSLSQSDHRATKFSDNVVLMTYKSSVDGTCDGNAVPKAVWSGTIFVKDGDAWKLAFHMATPGA